MLVILYGQEFWRGARAQSAAAGFQRDCYQCLASCNCHSHQTRITQKQCRLNCSLKHDDDKREPRRKTDRQQPDYNEIIDESASAHRALRHAVDRRQDVGDHRNRDDFTYADLHAHDDEQRWPALHADAPAHTRRWHT